MSFIENIELVDAAILVVGILVGWLAYFGWASRRKTTLRQQEARILNEARREAESILRESRLHGNEEALKLREQTLSSFQEREKSIVAEERRLIQREGLIDSRLETLVEKDQKLQEKQRELTEKTRAADEQAGRLHALEKTRREALEKISRLSGAEARRLVLKEAEEESQRDAVALNRRIVEQARAEAEVKAKKILGTAIQRYSSQYTFEATTSTIHLPGDEIKGRIIGREGRNIRAFEGATGITVLIDDTPGAVVLSGFDPVRREIARLAMQRLIADGRIHPTRIEEMVEQVRNEIEENIVQAGREAVLKLGLPPLPDEIVAQLGRLRFRLSYSQNILDHSIEVAQLCGLMASEMQLDVAEAKRAGLLHDIGKAISHETEGAHAKVGADFIQKHGLSAQVVNGVASHHGEVESNGPYGILVSAADAISASRPGARSETLDTYIKRLENLERIGYSLEGVEKCYAVHAGRELRVMVSSKEIQDDQAHLLARRLSRKIEEELQYPGQIRVTVIRETRCVEYAK